MREHSSVKCSSLVIAALVLASGCSPSEKPVALETPEPASAEPTTNPMVSGGRVVSTTVPDGGDIGDVPTKVMPRLVYQCSDEVTFAVRIAGNTLHVFPPGIDKSYVSLTRTFTEVGVRYVAMGADFRGNGDLATLQIGRDRYVDCVSNPAAQVWGTVQPSATR